MMKKKIFALVLALVMVLALVPAMAQAGSEQEDVTISKTATAVEGMVNAWDIELTVNAAAKVNPTPGNDVILVLDNSNSMYEGSRMANAKRAAKAFLDQLLPAGNTANRVGVVVFNSEVPSYQPLTADRAALEKFIGGVDQSLNGSPYTRPGYDKGGTFLEVGIEQAAELLRGSGANIKSMVLLSDGAPTYVRVNDKVVGDGTNYDETMYQPTVNAAKKSGAVVYSVALSAGEDGEHVLRGCASDTGKFFAVRNENDVAGLKDVFVTIAGTMTTACKNASAAPSGVDMTRRRSCTSCAVLPDSACCAACWSVWPPSLPESSCSRRCPSGERSTDCSASGFCRSRLASSFWFMERHLPFFPWDSICRGGGKRDARHKNAPPGGGEGSPRGGAIVNGIQFCAARSSARCFSTCWATE